MAKAGELNNITFQSLGPIATAAENHRLIVAQAEKDEAWRATRDKEKEKEKEKDKDKVEGEKPYMVNAGGVVDDFVCRLAMTFSLEEKHTDSIPISC